MRNYLLLFIGFVLFHVLGTWSLPLIDRDEPRFAEASREMRERRDWIVPYFNGHYRFDKPPLTYWAQAASYSVLGENDFAARFPSVVAASLTTLGIFAWASRAGTRTMAWWAAIVFGLSLQICVHAKAAVADMWLVLFVTFAHWAGYELMWQRQTLNADPAKNLGPSVGRRPTSHVPPIRWLTFYLSVALAFLAKGPIGLVPLLTISLTKLFRPNVHLRSTFSFGRGLLLTLTIICLWAVPALVRTHGEFFRIGIGRHVLARSFTTMEGHGLKGILGYLALLPLYFVTIFISFFPWSIKLPALVKEVRIIRDDLDNYLLCGTASIYLVFTIVVTKLPHYVLPAFPLLALLVARHITNQRFLTTAAAATVCLYLMIVWFVPPFAARYCPAAELYRQSRDFLNPEMQFGAVEFQEPSLVWYFRSRVKHWMTPLRLGNARKFMDETGPRFIVVPTERLEQALPNRPPGWKNFSTNGFNIPKGKQVNLTLVLKPE